MKQIWLEKLLMTAATSAPQSIKKLQDPIKTCGFSKIEFALAYSEHVG